MKHNFVNQHTNNLCQTCRLSPETQSDLLQCPEIAQKLKLLNLQENDDEEKFIYGNIDQQLIIVKIYSKVWELRTQKLVEISRQENVNCNLGNKVGRCMVGRALPSVLKVAPRGGQPLKLWNYFSLSEICFFVVEQIFEEILSMTKRLLHSFSFLTGISLDKFKLKLWLV